MDLRRLDQIWSKEDQKVGEVSGLHPSRKAFRVDWFDGSVSIELTAEEHVTWERVK